jgi:hypothetical protein
MRSGPKPTLVLTRLARGWFTVDPARRDRALVLSPIAESVRQALQALRSGGRRPVGAAAMLRSPSPGAGGASAAGGALLAARTALAAGNRPAAEAALARALLALV